eukprot:TRINITY_DN28054_c0_g1_i4.p1 TRINITY_DN28054_c0_g1~~TRINITY_DN28054_c0_g1_i4.p1  ORF type:complete len:136 (+),score=16.15 TRINITY_DN28054_c0_g1_i4:57-410(+)
MRLSWAAPAFLFASHPGTATSVQGAGDDAGAGATLCGEYKLPICYQASFQDARLPAVIAAAVRYFPGGAFEEQGLWSPNAESCARSEAPIEYAAAGNWSLLADSKSQVEQEIAVQHE